MPTTGPLEEGGPGEKISLPTSGKYLVVGLPAAFSKPCGSQVPGYVENEKAFAEKGYESIYVISVNDAFVTTAWKESIAKSSGVHFVADATGHFTNAMGMLFDASGLLGNHRSKRYVAAVDGGKITNIIAEDDPTQVTVTKADNVLPKL